ncbi:MAG TPA: DUF3352 domain-containing protein [Candidatus Limnocylindrales bacterium]|nr:DUF3352 domain-containing protein [Candidatus Limnocylindrales bacterium]
MDITPTGAIPEPLGYSGGMPPASPAPAPHPAGFRFRPWMAGAGGAVVALGAIGALSASLLLKSGPGIDKMVPDNTGLYATVYLDPSLPQKVNLLRMAHHFPDLHTDAQLTQKLNDSLDQALKETGLTYSKDIAPWLGARISSVTDFGIKPTTAVLFASKDDAAAGAALAKVRSSVPGKKLTWSTETYQGVTLSVGTNAGATTVYALVDHTAVLADSDGIVRDIIDTDTGKRATLQSTADYIATVALLPSDRLVLAYVNGPALVGMLKTEISKQGLATTTPIPDSAWKELGAFRGMGLTLAAGTDGLTGDVEVKVDSTKLDAAGRAALTSTRHNALLGWIPQRAFAVMATSGLKSSLQSGLDQAGTLDASTRDSLTQLGLLGPSGVVAHLTGDLAVEVESPAPQQIGGAILIGTTDPAGMQIFLTKLGTIAEFAASSSVPGSGLAATPAQKSVYKGVTIVTFPVSGLNAPGIAPSFAVTNGIGIVASSPAEIHDLIDAHSSGTSIAQATNFAATRAATFANPQSFLYVDVTATASAILSYVPAAQRGSYDSQVAPNLAPVKAIMVASNGQPDRISERVFVLIPN